MPFQHNAVQVIARSLIIVHFFYSKISSYVYYCPCSQASCRRNFSLDVVLLDALGQTVNKDIEVYLSGFAYYTIHHNIYLLVLAIILVLKFTHCLFWQVVASLLYADNGALVEKTTDGEAPLLASYDGIEYASCQRPSKLLQGRASFKLKISQVLVLYMWNVTFDTS